MTGPILGVAELAQAAGVKPRTLAAYLARGKCPAPDADLACGPVWLAATVAAWLEARDRRATGLVAAADAVVDRVAQGIEAQGIYRTQGARDHRPRRQHVIGANGRTAYHDRIDVGGGSYVDRDWSSKVPRPVDPKALAARDAYRLVAKYGARPDAPAELRNAARALRSRERALETIKRRQVNRTGDPDGFPF